MTVLDPSLLDERFEQGEKILTISEVAAQIGAGRMTVWRWVKKGPLPAYRVGHAFFLCQSDVNAFGLRPRKPGRPAGTRLSSATVRPEVGLRLRFFVLERDGFTCRYCGRKAPDIVLQVDHVVPRAKGGMATKENLVTSCRDCNLGKGALLLSSIEVLGCSARPPGNGR